MLEGNKSLFTSVTFWGVIMSVVSIVLKMLKIDIVDQAGWATDLAALSGLAVALYGRVRASKKIGMFAAFMIAFLAINSVQAAPPDSWSRGEWKYVKKIDKTNCYNLVVPSSGLLASTVTSNTGDEIPANSIVKGAYYQITTQFTGASDNTISMDLNASGDLVAAIGLDSDSTGYYVGNLDHLGSSGALIVGSTATTPTFSIGAGTTGYTAGAAIYCVDYSQIYPDAGLDE